MSSSLPVIHLRRLRKQAGLRQADVAALLNIHVNQVSLYERRLRKPPIEVLFGCCLIFGCTMQELYPCLHRRIVHTTKHNAEHLANTTTPKRTLLTDNRSAFLAALVTRI